MTYFLPEFGFNKLRQDMADLSRKATRLGLDPVILTEIRRTHIEHPFAFEDGSRQFVTMIEFQFTGTIPKVNGWTFIGSVEAKDTGNIFHPFPGFDIPERFRDRFLCDHCGTHRFRKLTYILRNDNTDALEIGPESGLSFIQVGSSCLRDFTRETRINRILSFYENIRERIDSMDEPTYGYHHGSIYMAHTSEYLARIACAVRIDGWVSRSMAEADSSKTATINNLSHLPRPEQQDEATAENALRWIRGFNPEDLPESGYLRNLFYACVEDYFNPQYSRGLLASLIPTYERAMHPTDAINNEWVGTVGEKMTITLALKQTLATQSAFGSCFIHKFHDLQDHLFVWITNRQLPEFNGPMRAKLQVKKHSEFRGVRQTEITYVRFERA